MTLNIPLKIMIQQLCSVNRPITLYLGFNNLLVKLFASNALQYFFNFVFLPYSFLVLPVINKKQNIKKKN